MIDAPLKNCPSCKQDTLARIIDGGAGLVFKGNGFYITDYKKSGGESKTEKKTETTAGTSESTDKKPPTTETKSPDSPAKTDKNIPKKE
jgi:predicted nucleic acid-binding Zn ribbon protein